MKDSKIALLVMLLVFAAPLLLLLSSSNHSEPINGPPSKLKLSNVYLVGEKEIQIEISPNTLGFKMESPEDSLLCCVRYDGETHRFIVVKDAIPFSLYPTPKENGMATLWLEPIQEEDIKSVKLKVWRIDRKSITTK